MGFDFHPLGSPHVTKPVAPMACNRFRPGILRLRDSFRPFWDRGRESQLSDHAGVDRLVGAAHVGPCPLWGAYLVQRMSDSGPGRLVSTWRSAYI